MQASGNGCCAGGKTVANQSIPALIEADH